MSDKTGKRITQVSDQTGFTLYNQPTNYLDLILSNISAADVKIDLNSLILFSKFTCFFIYSITKHLNDDIQLFLWIALQTNTHLLCIGRYQLYLPGVHS